MSVRGRLNKSWITSFGRNNARPSKCLIEQTVVIVIYTPPPDTGLSILYQDDYLLVVDKPSGLLSVPGRGEDRQDCLAKRVQALFPDALIVHRLDMSTSGLMVLARGKAMERALSIAFQQRRVHKCYEALVAGKCVQERGEVNLPLVTDWPNRPKQMVSFELGKASLTRYHVMDYLPEQDATRVCLEPITGRSHQLRVHMQALGHPILGDKLYAPPQVQAQSERLLLHAAMISLPHPVSGEVMTVSSAVPF